MALFKNFSIGTSRGSHSQSSRGSLSPHESNKPKQNASESEKETLSLTELKSRLLGTLIQLCGKDKRLIGMVKTLVTPILSSLTQAQIDEGATYLFNEIARLKRDNLITLMATNAYDYPMGTIENRPE